MPIATRLELTHVIAQGLSGFSPESAAFEAGRVMLRSLREYNFDRRYRPIASTWRLYDGSLLGERALIASGIREDEAVVVDRERWTEIQTRLETGQ